MGKRGFRAGLILEHVAVEMRGPAVESGGIAGGRGRACGADAGADSGDDFGRLEGLGDIIVGAKLQPGHPVLYLRPARDNDHRRAAFQRQPVDQRQPVAVGQRQVHKADIRGDMFQRRFECAGAGKALGAETGLFQNLCQHLADLGLVIEDGDERGGVGRRGHFRSAFGRTRAASWSASKGLRSTGARSLAASCSGSSGGSEVISTVGRPVPCTRSSRSIPVPDP